MRARAWRATLVVALLPASAAAQTLSLTEAEALSRLAAGSPLVEAARADIAGAQAEVLAAARWPNPRVAFSREAVAGVAEEMLTVSQALPITGRRQLEMNAAAARVSAVTVRADDRVRRLRADLRLAFTSLWSSQAREQALVGSRDRLRGLVTVLTRRTEAGESAGFDRLRAEREALDVEADLAAAAVDRARAQALLASYLPPSAEPAALAAVRGNDTSAPLPPVEQLVARAETARGDLIALRHEVEAAELLRRAAGRRLWPEPEVVAGTKSSNAGAGDTGSMFGVQATVPLFDRAAPERAAAQARGLQARAEGEALRRTLRAQIGAWHAAVIERRAIAERYRAAVGASVDQIERIAQVSYEAGERGILELLDAHRTAAAARVRQAELDAAAREAEIELEYVSGWELP